MATGIWDLIKLHQVFYPIDIERITSIRIVPQLPGDTHAWLPHPDGNFTIKRGYHFAKNLIDQNAPIPSTSTANQSIQQQFWKLLWSCPIIPRIIMRAWQAAKNRLPTGLNLFKRKILTSQTCSYCLQEPESLTHILYNCSFAKQVLEFTKVIQDRNLEALYLDASS